MSRWFCGGFAHLTCVTWIVAQPQRFSQLLWADSFRCQLEKNSRILRCDTFAFCAHEFLWQHQGQNLRLKMAIYWSRNVLRSSLLGSTLLVPFAGYLKPSRQSALFCPIQALMTVLMTFFWEVSLNRWLERGGWIVHVAPCIRKRRKKALPSLWKEPLSNICVNRFWQSEFLCALLRRGDHWRFRLSWWSIKVPKRCHYLPQCTLQRQHEFDTLWKSASVVRVSWHWCESSATSTQSEKYLQARTSSFKVLPERLLKSDLGWMWNVKHASDVALKMRQARVLHISLSLVCRPVVDCPAVLNSRKRCLVQNQSEKGSCSSSETSVCNWLPVDNFLERPCRVWLSWKILQVCQWS